MSQLWFSQSPSCHLNTYRFKISNPIDLKTSNLRPQRSLRTLGHQWITMNLYVKEYSCSLCRRATRVDNPLRSRSAQSSPFSLSRSDEWSGSSVWVDRWCRSSSRIIVTIRYVLIGIELIAVFLGTRWRGQKLSPDYSLFFWLVNKCAKTTEASNNDNIQSLTFGYRYSEAIVFLYSANVFHVNDIRCLLVFPELLIPPHFNTIRFLHVNVEFEQMWPIILSDIENYRDNFRKEFSTLWASQWKNVASMEGLRELQIIISPGSEKGEIWKLIPLLDPLKLITKPELFVVTIPSRVVAHYQSALQKRPFEIRIAPDAIYLWV